MAKTGNITQRKRLSELYANGVEVRFHGDGDDVKFGIFDPKKKDDEGKPTQVGPVDELGELRHTFEPSDDDVIIWVQPPSPLQREEALRDAQAARSRAFLDSKKEDSPEALNTKAFLANMGHDTLIDYLLSSGEQERRERAQREVLGRDEWDDFTALQDAMRQWNEAGSPRDSEQWKSLLERDEEFGKQVNDAANYLREADRESLKLVADRRELERRAFDKRVEMLGSQHFMSEYEKRMTHFGARDPENKKELFFESVADLMSEDEEVWDALSEALVYFLEDPAEAKNSPRAADGSQPSELPEKRETSEASTPKEGSD